MSESKSGEKQYHCPACGDVMDASYRGQARQPGDGAPTFMLACVNPNCTSKEAKTGRWRNSMGAAFAAIKMRVAGERERLK